MIDDQDDSWETEDARFRASDLAIGLAAWSALVLLLLLLLLAAVRSAFAADLCDRYRSTLIREAQAVHGIAAPVPMFMGQIRQESSCRAEITAVDDGRGLAQFMDGTARQVAAMFPELGPPAPYDPRWAIRAMVRYDGWLYARVRGDDACQRWAAALKGYNAGLGYVQRAQRLSAAPSTWFGATEHVNAGQSAKNFEYSRRYPRVILWKHQPRYAGWGEPVCPGSEP